MILKSDEHPLEVQVEITSTKVQLPLYYSHFEITEFSQYQNLFAEDEENCLKKRD